MKPSTGRRTFAACRDDAGTVTVAGLPEAAAPGPLGPLALAAIPFELLSPGGFFPAPPPVSAPGGGDPERAIHESLRRAAGARYAMAWGAALQAAAAAESAAEREGLPALASAARLEGAATAILAGAPAQAEDLCRRVLAAAPDAAARAAATLNLGVAAGVRGDFGEAREVLAAAEGLAGGAASLLWTARLNRAAALTEPGTLAEAEILAADALRAGRRLRDRELEAAALFGTGIVRLARGRLNLARARLGEALRLYVRADDRLRQVLCHHLLGEIAYEGEDPIRAGKHYRDGLGLARPAGAAAAVELLMLRFEHR